MARKQYAASGGRCPDRPIRPIGPASVAQFDLAGRRRRVRWSREFLGSTAAGPQ
jgi:hypothetical protein